MRREFSFHLIIFGILILPLGLLSQQEFVLIPNSNLEFSTDCIDIELDERVNFIRDASCGPLLLITLERGDKVVFSTPKINSSYTFLETGEYTLFCNGAADNAVVSMCINVYDPTLVGLDPPGVPTMGEWSVVILFELLMIFGVLGVSRNYNFKM